jgi:hypothetical protein
VKTPFLLDEHVNVAIQRQLRRLEPSIQVLVIGDKGAPPKGILDPDLLIWLENHQYILVTNNRSSMPDHLRNHYAAGRHIPGLFWIRPDATLGEVITTLHLVWAASEAEEYYDRVVFIPF